jgi:hypothetical protein
MGFGTNRVVSKGLNKNGLTVNQLKGMNTLQNICGVKKNDPVKQEGALQEILKHKNSESPNKNKLMCDLSDEAKEEKKVISISSVNLEEKKSKKPIISLKNLI